MKTYKTASARLVMKIIECLLALVFMFWVVYELIKHPNLLEKTISLINQLLS